MNLGADRSAIKHFGVVAKDDSGRNIKTAWQHWTSQGLLQVFWTPIGPGMPMAAFYFRGEFVELVGTPADVVRLIRSGAFDAESDFKFSSLRIPSDVSRWNGLNGSPRYEIPF